MLPIPPPSRRAAVFGLVLACLVSLIAPSASAEPEIKKTFDVPAGDASETLRRFAQQAGQQIVYPVREVRGVQTNRVSGEFTPAAGMAALLAGTDLRAVFDAASNSIAVHRAPPENVDAPKAKDEKHPRSSAASDSRDDQQLADDAVVQLSPFLVESDKDTGYIATDTVSGGRMSTNLLTTPADVSILTREFLDDIIAFDLKDALLWLPSSDVVDGNALTNPDFGNSYSFRGLGGATNTVNNVRQNTAAELYSIERLEQSRGPNSILYGDAVSGGQMNVTTKQARFRNFATVQLRADTYGSRQLTTDGNYKVSNKLAVRVSSMLQERRSWLERYYDDRASATLAVTYRPWKHTEIRFDGQLTYSNVAAMNHIWVDQASNWDGVTAVSGPLSSNPAAATGVSRFTSDSLFLSPAWHGVLNFRNFGQTTGTGLNLDGNDPLPLKTALTIDREGFTMAPPESNVGTHAATAALTLVQEFPGEFVVEVNVTDSPTRRHQNLIGQTVNYRIDVNKVLPNGSVNPNFGKPYTQGTVTVRDIDQYQQNYRILAAYPLPFLKDKMRQVISVGWERRNGLFDTVNLDLGRSNNPTSPNYNNTSNLVRFWRYFDDPGAAQPLPRNGQNGYNFVWGTSRDTRTVTTNDSYQFTTVGTYFKQTLTLIAGARFDDYNSRGRDSIAYNALGTPTAYSESAYTSRARNRSLGATYFPIRSIGVYLNYAEGFFPLQTGNPWIGDRGSVGATTSIGESAGLRFRLFEGKFVGSAGYYKSRERDRILSLNPDAFDQIWTDLGKSELQITPGGGNYSDTLQYWGQGYEVDLTANVSKQFRAKFNVAFPETKQTGARPDTIEYVAKHEAEWQAGANDPANPNRARIQQNLESIRTMLSGLSDGRSLNLTFKYRANIFANYSFQTGWLKGVSLNGGAQFFGKQLVGNRSGDSFDYIYGDAYTTVLAGASYALKVKGIPVTFRLSIANLLDYDEVVYRGVTSYQGTVYRNGFMYVEPRSVSFTTAVAF